MSLEQVPYPERILHVFALPLFSFGLNVFFLATTFSLRKYLAKNPSHSLLRRLVRFNYFVQAFLMISFWIVTILWLWMAWNYSQRIINCLGELRPYLNNEVLPSGPCHMLYSTSVSAGVSEVAFLAFLAAIYSLPISFIASLVLTVNNAVYSSRMDKLRLWGLPICAGFLIGNCLWLLWLRFPEITVLPSPF
jgi:putative flippase GtrA